MDTFDFLLKNFMKGGAVGFVIFLIIAVVVVSALFKDASKKVEKDKSEKDKIDDHLLKP
ncbi:hypothetical protein ES703_20657 [subsurface metagenome]